MTGTRDWRSAAAYADTALLPVSGWAWEFLRRNPEYRAGTRAAVPRSAEYAAVGRRWGLSFRRGPGPDRPRHGDLLDTGPAAGVGAVDPGPRGTHARGS
ncbi:transcriptional regulator domain-containing protein [Azospirillum doebereinerae]